MTVQNALTRKNLPEVDSHGNQCRFIVNIILPNYAKFFHSPEILLKKEISRPEIPTRVNVPMNSKDRIRFALLTVTDQSK